MVITMVIDQFDGENNGTTISTRRFVKALRERGHTVRVVAGTDKVVDDIDFYPVKIRHIPIASSFAKKQGLWFAEANVKTLTEAITGSDVVHVLMPFKLEKKAIEVANKLGIPVTGAFHVQAENVTTQLSLKDSSFANRFVYNIFRRSFYKKLTHIHCPSKMIACELKKNRYKAKLHVVSNGVGVDFCRKKVEKPEELKNKFVILFIGRLSLEKRHDLLIDAVSKSKYANDIKLMFAGKGPIVDSVYECGKKLPVEPRRDFYKEKELIDIINYSDLYVHPADIEIEAIACVEAFSCGLVPVISDNEKCATKQFALCPESLFENGNSDDLRDKIDFWIEHPEYKEEMSKKYEEYGKDFGVHNTIISIEEMFKEAISEYHK